LIDNKINNLLFNYSIDKAFYWNREVRVLNNNKTPASKDFNQGWWGK